MKSTASSLQKWATEPPVQPDALMKPILMVEVERGDGTAVVAIAKEAVAVVVVVAVAEAQAEVEAIKETMPVHYRK